MGRRSDQWIKDLQSDDVEKRRKAADVLGWIGAEAIPPLISALRDRDSGVRDLAATSLGDLGAEAVPALLSTVQDGDPNSRKSSIQAIAKIGPESVPAIFDLLRQPSTISDVKKSLLKSMETMGSQAIPQLLDAMNEPKSRSDALTVIVNLGTEAIPNILESLERPERSEVALDALEKLGALAIPSLLKAQDSPATVQLSNKVFKKLGAAAIPALKKAYNDAALNNDEARSLQVVQVYAEIGEHALEELLAALIDKNERVRRVAATAIGAFQGDARAAMPTLIRALRDRIAAVRRAAAKALGNLGVDAIPDLKAALLHRDRRMRQGAIYALKKLDPTCMIALEALEETLNNPRWYIRRSALSALGRLKQKAMPLVPQLVPMLEDRDARIRFAAAEALAFISPTHAVQALSLFTEALGNASIRQQATDSIERLNLFAVVPLIEATEKDKLKIPATDLLWRIGAKHIPALAKAIEPRSTGVDVMTQSFNSTAMTILTHKLDSEEASLRAFAVWALGTQGKFARGSISQLINRLIDPNQKVRMAASISLGQIGPDAIPPLIEVLDNGAEELRPFVVEALGRIETRDLTVANGLLRRLEDPLIGPEEARQISRVLSHMTNLPYGSKAIPKTISILERGNPHARAAIVSALANIGPKAIPELLIAVGHDKIRVRQGAVSALRQAPEKSIRALIRCLGNQKHRHAAALALGLKSADWIVRRRPERLTTLLENESELLVEILIKSLKNTDERSWLAKALADIGPSAVPKLAESLRSELGEARHAVALALARASPILSAAVIPLLANIIRADDPELRRVAALTLGSLGHVYSPVLLETLEDLAADSKTSVRQWVMVALGNLEGLGLDMLMDGLRDKHPKVRQSAAYALRGLGARAQEAFALLVTHLNDEDEHVRWRSVGALIRLFEENKELIHGSEETTGLLIGKLQDSSAKVVQGASLALVRIGANAVPELTHALQSEHQSVRRWASWALGKIGQDAYSPQIKNAVPALCTLLTDNDSSIAQSGAWALGKIGPDAREAVVDLKAALKNSQTGLRWFAAYALGAIGREARGALPELEAALLDEDEDVRREAAFALTQISSASDDKVLPILISALKTKVAQRDTGFRRRALEALQALGPKTTPHLFEALKNKSPSVRYAAAIILAKVSPLAVHAVLPILLEALQSQDCDIQPGAVEALGLLGLEAHSAIPLLLDALESEFSAVRAASIKALALVTPKPEIILYALTGALEDKDPELRLLAAKMVGQVGKHTREDHLKPIVLRLIVGLWDPDPKVCQQVTKSIGELGLPAVKSLITVLPHKDPAVARRAVTALTQIGLDAIPDLLRSMASKHVWTRLRAAEAMTAIWPVASVAIPDLLESLQSTDIWVRQNALRLLEATSLRLKKRQNRYVEDQRPMQLIDSGRDTPLETSPSSLRPETFVFEDFADDDEEAHD
jgi:HEAT repeat protein